MYRLSTALGGIDCQRLDFEGAYEVTFTGLRGLYE